MTELNTLAAASGDTNVSPEAPAEELDLAARPTRWLEIAIAATALVLSVTAFILSRNIYLRMGSGGLDPKWWPTLLSVFAGVLSAVLLGMSVFGPAASRGELESSHRDGLVRMLSALTLSVLYALAWTFVGYVVPTVLYLVALLGVFGLRSWKGLVAFPLITTAFIYGLFHFVLRVPL